MMLLFCAHMSKAHTQNKKVQGAAYFEKRKLRRNGKKVKCFLKKKRERGDMVMMYKCITVMKKTNINYFVIPESNVSRGYFCKLLKTKIKKDIRNYIFFSS